MKAGKDVIALIKLAYASNRPVLIEGKHGCGKSQLIEQASQHLGIECIVRDLSLMEPPDLIGLPRHDNGVTRYSPPAFLPTSGKGLLVFEELNRCEKYMMAPCLQLLTARRLNDYVLPPGWLPVAAINPSDDGYDVNECDLALRSRFINITIKSSVREWLKWAESSEVHSAVCRFVKNTPNIFEAAESNPRAWKYVSDVLQTYQGIEEPNEGLLAVAISGLVGEALGVAFTQNYLNGEEPLSATAIFDEYDSHRKTVKSWVKDKRVDLLNATCHNVMVELQNRDVAVRVANMETARRNLDDFSSDIPADLGKKLRKASKDAGVKL